MRVFYLDLFLITELIIDFFLVCAAAVIAGEPIKRLRCFAAAGLSAVLSLVILLPPLHPAVMLAAKLLSAAAITAAAFGIKPRARYIKNMACFIGATGIFGGSVYAFAMAFSRPISLNNLTYYFGGAPLVLLFVITLFYVAVRAGMAWWGGRIPQKGTLRLIIKGPCGSKSIAAFIDTGNRLRDAVSGRYVVVVSRAAVFQILSPELLSAVSAVESGRPPPAGVRFVLVPCETAAGNGLLVAFPEVEIYAEFKKGAEKTDLLAAVSWGKSGFDALIGQEAVKNLRGVI